ncbi:MAG: hypothetical protein R2834_14775 [Rhodothermales bacterium]
MKVLTPVVLGLALAVSACAPTENGASVPSAAVVDSTMLRPDPLHPVGGDMITPPGWTVRLDTPDPAVAIGGEEADDIFFVSMTPGWHIRTGPAGIFYHPSSTASGAYTARTTIHLFDPGERNEAFGLFFGGKNLAGDNQTYDYFLIRNSGEFLVKRRIGAETQVVLDWQPQAAINRYTDPAVSSVSNTLAVRIQEGQAVFLINDQEVARLPAADVQTDGIVGLRVNHALNLHISDFAVVPR